MTTINMTVLICYHIKDKVLFKHGRQNIHYICAKPNGKGLAFFAAFCAIEIAPSRLGASISR
jgi:hypothetical protein